MVTGDPRTTGTPRAPPSRPHRDPVFPPTQIHLLPSEPPPPQARNCPVLLRTPLGTPHTPSPATACFFPEILSKPLKTHSPDAPPHPPLVPGPALCPQKSPQSTLNPFSRRPVSLPGRQSPPFFLTNLHGTPPSPPPKSQDPHFSLTNPLSTLPPIPAPPLSPHDPPQDTKKAFPLREPPVSPQKHS